jgi:sulfite exporter TauE/SafE
MASLLASFTGGLLLGLAGAVHCACMCGGIAMTALSISGAKTPGEKLRFLLRAQIGRIGVYMIAGGVLAGTADVTLNFASAGDAHRIMQLAAAAFMMWTGLSLAGLAPAFALPVRATRLRFPPSLAGAAWGFFACPMVYAALFSASLTGTPIAGSAWMAGFGLGTIAPVTLAALGLSQMTRFKSSHAMQVAFGLSIAAFGVLSAGITAPALAFLCRSM